MSTGGTILKILGVGAVAAGAYWLGKHNFGFGGLGYESRETMLPPEPAPWELPRYNKKVGKRKPPKFVPKGKSGMSPSRVGILPPAPSMDGFEGMFGSSSAGLGSFLPPRIGGGFGPRIGRAAGGGFGPRAAAGSCTFVGFGDASHDELRRIKQKVDEAQRALDLALRRR